MCCYAMREDYGCSHSLYVEGDEIDPGLTIALPGSDDGDERPTGVIIYQPETCELGFPAWPLKFET